MVTSATRLHRWGSAFRAMPARAVLAILAGGVVAGVLVRLKDAVEPALSLAVSLGSAWVVLLLAPGVGLILHAAAFSILLPSELRPSPLASLRAQVVASAGNWLGGGVLGEPAKVACIRAGTRRSLLGYLALDNLLQFASTCCAIWLGVQLCAPWLFLEEAVIWIRFGAVLALVVALVLAFAWPAHHGPLESSKSRWLTCAGLHGLGKAWIVVEFALTLELIRGTWESGVGSAVSVLPATFETSLALATSSALTSTLGAVLPGQLGALELVLQRVGEQLTLPVEVVLAVIFVRRVRSLVWVGVGALLQGVSRGS